MTSSPLAMTAMRNLKDNRSPRRYPRKSMAECTAREPNIEVDIDGLLNQIHSINGAVTAACLSEDGYFSQDEAMDPAMSRSAERKLTEPLENLAVAFEIILGKVKDWADRARYFEQNTVVKAKQTPAAKGRPLTSSNIDVEEEAVHYVMKLLQETGPIDKKYLQLFDHFINETSRPLSPMFHLISFIESIADTANGRPCSIATKRAAEANPQAPPKKSEHAESDKENDSPSYCPEHSSDSDHDMPDAAAARPLHTDTGPSPSLLPTPPLTSKATTFPHLGPPPSPPQPQANTLLTPSFPRPSLTHPPPTITPFYITRLASRGHPPATLTRPSATDGPIWTRILYSARLALFAADHLASHAESAKDHARNQQKVWRRMTDYFDERAGLIRRFRAEGGLPGGSSDEEPVVPTLTAEEREEHEAAEAVRRVEEMIQRESSGGGGGVGDDGDAEGDDVDEEEEEEGDGDGEMRARYRQGMQRFEREERWRRSPSIKWTDQLADVGEQQQQQQLGSEDEHRGRSPRRLQPEDKGKTKAGAGRRRSPQPSGFGSGFGLGINNNTSFSRLGLNSAFGGDVDMLGEPQSRLATRSPLEVKGKGKVTPQNWDERPGKGQWGESGGVLGQWGGTSGLDDDGDDDEKTRNRLLRSMRGMKRKGG